MVIGLALAVILLGTFGAYRWLRGSPGSAGPAGGALEPVGTGPAGAPARTAASAVSGGPSAAAVPVTGRLVVGYEQARVFVDGVQESRSPTTVYELPPGDHQVRLETPNGTVRRAVRINAGEETWLALPLTPGPPAPAPTNAPSTGWLRLSTPLEVQLFEGERFLGTSRVDRMLMEAGNHEITLVADAVGYRETHRVSVKPGATSELAVKLPPGRLNINAVPWANVFIDGQAAGETPIGNLEVTSGPHEIRLVHPTLGEVTRTVIVKVGEPARVGVDLRK